MSDIGNLTTWMDKHNLTTTDLAREISMSYDGVYQVLFVRKALTPGFIVRFMCRFGAQEAAAALGIQIEGTAPEPTAQ